MWGIPSSKDLGFVARLLPSHFIRGTLLTIQPALRVNTIKGRKETKGTHEELYRLGYDAVYVVQWKSADVSE
jgi:hypothetical protein